MTPRLPVFSALFALFLLICGPAFAAKLNFMADLNGSSVFPPVSTFATGRADFSYDTDTGRLSWSITHRNLAGDPVKATFFRRDDFGRPTVPVHEIEGQLRSPITGATEIPIEEVRELMAGQWFFMLHTVIFPDGEIGGAIEVARGSQMMGTTTGLSNPDESGLSR